MPKSHPNHPYKSANKRILWLNRYLRLKEWLLSLPPLLVLRAEKLSYIFFRRKSLILRLADNYLIKLFGGVSRATVQRTLQKFEALGLLKRITSRPKLQLDGSWKQERKLVLLLPKVIQKEHFYLVPHSGQPPELQENPVGKKLTQSVEQKDFADYLCSQQRVSRGAWAYWLRKNGASPNTLGYLLSSIHSRIQHRPDVLESILFDAEAQRFKGKRLVSYTISEIKSRTVA